MQVKISSGLGPHVKPRMPKLEKRHRIDHRAVDMFNLVCDVENYPQFVPLCKSLKIRDRRERNAKTLVVADMTMAYKMLSETFTTQVLMDHDALKIAVKYIEGPFKHLDNAWHFEALDDNTCMVHFLIDYELRSKMLAMAAGTVFEMAFGQFVGAFERRADEIYA